MNKQNCERIIDLIYMAHLYLEKLESTPRDYGSGDLLYSTDIHTIVAVSKSPGCNLTALAAQLNISKAAVSKFVAKLVRSGYLIKSRPVDNDREVIFSLTKKGQTAAVGHEQFEEKTFGPFFQLETALPEQEKKIIKEYFKKLISIAEQ